MPLRSTNHNIKKHVITCVVFMIITGFAAWLMPRGLGLYYQVKAGNLLGTVLEARDNAESVTDFCFHQAISDDEQSLLREAAAYLEKSIAFDPQAAHSYLLLGRVYCLLDSPAEAVSAYEVYAQMRPENPLGHLELGFGYEAECHKTNHNATASKRVPASDSLCPNSELQALIAKEWEDAGATADQFFEDGNLAFSSQNYTSAADWYKHGAAFLASSLPSGILLKWEIASVIAHHTVDNLPNNEELIILPLSESLKIEAETLRWLKIDPHWNLEYGNQLIDHPSSNPNVGVMWWSGQAATFIQTDESGMYELTIRVQNTPPAPIKLKLEHNFTTIEQFEFSKEDMSWEERTVEYYLAEGVHLIIIQFLNDDSVDGVDRNAVIDWLEIKRK